MCLPIFLFCFFFNDTATTEIYTLSLHDALPIYINTTLEVCGSRLHIIGNLTLPWQNWFNSSEYLVGWIDPYGQSDSAVRGNLSECNYLSDRTVSGTFSSWASWNSTDGLYNRVVSTISGDGKTLATLNSSFDTVYANDGIYHLYMHPHNNNWSDSDIMPQHLTYIGNRTDVWYVGWGQLYMYHYLEDRLKPTINLTTYNNQQIIFKMNVSEIERNKYGLSYQVTYAFYLPNLWSYVFVFYKNISNDNYSLMTEKTSDDFFNGIDAYRTNLSENIVYISKGFPQTSNEFYLKVVPVLSTNFAGSTTDFTTTDISSITNLVLENSSYGKINFSESVNLSVGGDLNTYINISDNYIYINSTALSALNKSATLTLYNLSYTNPRILKDGVVCPSSICTEVSYTGGTFTFTVTSFSNYSAEETPSTLEDTEETSSGGYPTYHPTQEQITEGYSKLMAKNWKVQFTIKNNTYTAIVNSVDSENKTLEIELEEVNETIKLGENETKKIDLNDDGYYDLQISVNFIDSYNNANMTFKEIHEEIPAEKQEEKQAPSKIKEKEIKDWMWIVGGIILLVFIGFVIRKLLKKGVIL